jgi:two-component system sensor histidine kinase PilS (NtrC family)
VLTANLVAAEILREPASALVGRPLAEVLPSLPDGDRRAPLRADLALRKGGHEIYIGATVSALRDVHDEVIGKVINFQDLTELRRLELQSRRAERLATVGQLAAGVAHEIRNPLASISGSIELLRQTPQQSDDDRTLMAIVQREIQRLNVLIGDLLDYANPRPMQAVDFDLGSLVEETLRVARAEPAFEDVELAADVEQPLTVHADPAKLRQVVWNLVRNARDAAKLGGKHVRVEARRENGDATIAIRDDGPGIAKELVARIFDPFVTTKDKGTGLGLATCHAVIAEHNGRIDVETEAGQGTTMIVTLPAGDVAR